jgi:hypothetical protein
MRTMRQEMRSMAPLNSATSSPAEVRLEKLVGLVYELLDAHADTDLLAREIEGDLSWAAHLDYLRALQRVAREVMADVC